MFRRLTSSALALAAMTAPSFADVTPEQVWQSWVDYYQSVGYSVTEGSRDKAGSTLTLRDVLIAGGAEGNTMTFKVPSVALSDQGDGKVKTVFAEEMSLDVAGRDPEGGDYAVPVKIMLPGNGIVTSGAPEDMTHEFDYPSIELVMTTMTDNGEETPLPMSFGLTKSTGMLHIVTGAPNKYDYDMNSEALTFQGDVTDDEGGAVKFAGSLNGLNMKGGMDAPGEFKDLDEQMDAALKAGLSMNGALDADSVNATFDYEGVDEEGQPSQGAGKYLGQGIKANFSLSKDGMGYKLSSDAVDFELTSPQIPFPVSYGIENAGVEMQLPVSQSDEAQPFKFTYLLNGVTMSDDLWSMFDPTAKLPRDPASLELDLSGLMKVTRDVFAMPETLADDADASADDAQERAEPDAMTDEMAAEETTGFEPVEMNINKLALNLLGANLLATGELKATEEGIGAPIGHIHAEYEGLNALLDTLGSIGLIPQEQMMGARMMLAMFAKPVEGSPDKMATDLELKEGGSIFANGQQIK
ncbi:DUF2125 domain-containing protein [Paracoccus sp. MBLB3053]|uniref:DUF2125 domain-containing protein n=1 Tax=Paracoccus aurantius TaxID=3073814 RepID=A0ABU2HPD7_9RHOB|nr:DUF2125 domain-containing protein [Paracoccus sp. MBLB3053]MDS9466903.1 DUF2125 domain-containing protein [Paracoccus sp. MBLB3053]